MPNVQLIHPIYLDVPMLVSFAAAIQGGLSLQTEVTQEKSSDKSGTTSASGTFGLSNLFSNLFDLSADIDISGALSDSSQETRRESKSHTEASIAILLYTQLLDDQRYLTRLENASDLSNVDPGTLVEVSGIIEKNAVDAIIDFIDAATILSSLADSQPNQVSKSSNQGKSRKKQNQTSEKNQLERLREALDNDRKRTPISNVILRSDTPSGMNVVVTLRTENLRDLTLSELHKNSVRVIGKVTRVINEGESMSAFENYGLSLLEPDTLHELFVGVTKTPGIVAEFSEVVVEGPAFQILPLMIFV